MDTSRVYCYKWSNPVLVRFIIGACDNCNTQWNLSWQESLTNILFTKYWNPSSSNSESKRTLYLPQRNGLVMSLNHMIHNILFIKILGPDKLGQSRYCISPKRWYFIYKSCLPWRLFWRKRPKDLFIHINFQRMVSLITLEFVYHLAIRKRTKLTVDDTWIRASFVPWNLQSWMPRIL